MDNTITYRLVNESDITRIANLVNAQYARKKDAAYFKWQFFNSYYPTICMCAVVGNQIVGMFGLQKRKLTDGHIVGHLIDLLVDPNWRGKGIFKKMGELAIAHFNDLQALTVLPNPNGKVACEKSFDMKTISKIDDLVCEKSDSKTIKIDPKDSSLLRYETNEKYRNWRFDQSPIYKYTKIKSDDESLTITKKFTDPTTKDSFMDLVDYKGKTLAVQFEENNPKISTWALPHTNLYTRLKSHGFKELARERYFCVKVLDSNLKHYYDIKTWNLVPADAEIY